MAAGSKIEWTELTWNPTTGCTKISPGCKHCYAEVMARRLSAMGAVGYDQGFKLALHPQRLSQPKARQKPTIYFVNSMSDIFHNDISDDFLDELFSIIKDTPQHTYQLLTKRSERLVEYFASRSCPQNAWIGVSVEDRRYGVPRIDHLRKIAAPVRFLSIEPLLEDLGSLDLSGMHWVIVGGESGHGARPMKAEWVQSIKRQVDAVGAHFFFKQWGAFGSDGVKRNNKVNGRIFEGKTWDARPVPLTAPPKRP